MSTGGDDLVVRPMLGAQLHDVDAARQRPGDEIAGDHVAYQVQAGALQARAAIVHGCECGRPRTLGSRVTGALPSG